VLSRQRFDAGLHAFRFSPLLRVVQLCGRVQVLPVGGVRSEWRLPDRFDVLFQSSWRRLLPTGHDVL
jgi:hypothetical protein